LSACVENSGELGWVVGCSLGGERWDGKEEKGETEEESVGRGGVYIMAFTDGITDEIIRRYFHRWKCHVTVWLSQFESLGHSVGKIVWKNSTSPHRCIVPNKLYRPSAIWSVYTDGNIMSIYTDRISDGFMPSVYTDRFWDGIILVGNNYRWKNFVGIFVGFHRFFGSDIYIYI